MGERERREQVEGREEKRMGGGEGGKESEDTINREAIFMRGATCEERR